MANDNDIYKVLIGYLEQELLLLGITASVQQGYQPQIQSIKKDLADGAGAQVFLFKVRDKRYGSRKVTAEFEAGQPIDQEFNMTYKQVMQTTFQASCMVRQNPEDVNSLTASDVLNDVAYILQSPETITYFNDDFQLGIERVVDLPQTYTIDDKDEYEAVPNLEFVITHHRIQERRAPQVKSEELKVLRV